MTTKNLRSYKREAWVIPNGKGQLWTDRIFSTEIEAKEYIDTYWANARWTRPKHQPLKTWVQAVAKIPSPPVRPFRGLRKTEETGDGC